MYQVYHNGGWCYPVVFYNIKAACELALELNHAMVVNAETGEIVAEPKGE